MEYRLLGASGCVVSTFALGTMTFGDETSEEDSRVQLDRFLDVGGSLVDTADVYSGGASEEIIGRWIATCSPAKRSALVLATKARFPMGTAPNDVGLSRRHLRSALERSLRILHVETIDLYQVHAFDPLTPIEETLRFLDDATREGKILYVGLSNFTGWQIQKTVDMADKEGLVRPVTLQPQYNLLAREIEWEIVPACLSEGLGLLPWSPLGGGWLTGKYRRDEQPTGANRLGEGKRAGVEAFGKRNPMQRTWDVIAALEQVASARSVPLAQVALSWLVDRPAVTSVILGARTLEQFEVNLATSGLHLDEEEVSLLDSASATDVPDYPYGEGGISQRSRALPAPQQ